MATYQDLKSRAYLEQNISFAKKLLNIKLVAYGQHKFTSLCPFHGETKGSFRVYVNAKDEVRFHCFGACKTEWDIYDLIIKRRGCSFSEAQQIFARYIGEEHFKAHRSNISLAAEEQAPVLVSCPETLDPEITDALEHAAALYHNLLTEHPDRYRQVYKYLARRGIAQDTIERFCIGFAPPFKDQEFEGRALILHTIRQQAKRLLLPRRMYNMSY